MKATGIVRRIDDLGRVVIPKEIGRTMRIREGDPSYTRLSICSIKSRYSCSSSHIAILIIIPLYIVSNKI